MACKTGAFPRALLSLLIRYMGVIVTIFIGSTIFMHTENVGIEEEITHLNATQASKAIEKLRVIKDFERKLNIAINVTVFDELMQRIQNLSTKTKPNKWDHITGAHYAFTIVSTIGYGVIVPTTDATRLATIFYALIGIPIFLYAMSAAGTVKTLLGENLFYAIEIKLMKRSEIRNKKWKIICFAVVSCILELLAAAGIVYREEDWPFFIALYYWFVSASTIGFGDYVLSFKGNNQLDSAMLVVFFFVTLVLMSDLGCIFSTISEIIEERGHGTRKRSCMGMTCCKHNVSNTEEGNAEQIDMQKM